MIDKQIFEKMGYTAQEIKTATKQHKRLKDKTIIWNDELDTKSINAILYFRKNYTITK